MTPVAAPVRSRHIPVLALLLALLALPGDVLGHSVGENYIFVSFRATAIEGRFEIHQKDLEDKLGLTIGGTHAEMLAALRASAPKVQAYILAHFSIAAEEGAAYPLQFHNVELLKLPQGLFAQYHFHSESGPLPDRLRIHHSMLYEGDRLHRGLLIVNYNARTGIDYGAEYVAMVFGPAAPDQELNLTSIPHLLGGREMVWQGVLHIWIGIDHVLFLVALMLPTVLVARGGNRTPVPGYRAALWNLLKIVTVFTIAHSVTLMLAALGLLDVPSRVVESVIALSIALVALNNITGRVQDGSLLVILALGLFHGLGFASVMGHLPFRVEDLVKAVLGFNIGVELGQMAIVAALFPLLFFLRTQRLYLPVILKGGSALLILISTAWFVERAFGLG